MKILIWVIRLLVFFCLFVFAVQNTDSVALRLIPGQSWQAPLVIVLLVFFALGALLGISSLLGLVIRQHREIASLKRKPPTAEKKTEQVDAV